MSLIAPTIIETAVNVVKAAAKHWRAVLIVIVVLAAAITGVCVYKRVFNRPPKLNQKEIVQAQQAIEKQDREQMRQILVESEVREAMIDANVATATGDTVNAIHESKKKWADASVEDMQAELERRAAEGN
jgi:Na+/H+ antiporter NhaB